MKIDKQKLKEFLGISEELNKLIADCKFDLIYGSNGLDDNYEGFDKSMGRIRKLLDNIPREIYYDNDCGQFLLELDENACNYEIYKVEVYKELFGKELYVYI